MWNYVHRKRELTEVHKFSLDLLLLLLGWLCK